MKKENTSNGICIYVIFDFFFCMFVDILTLFRKPTSPSFCAPSDARKLGQSLLGQGKLDKIASIPP